MEIGYESLKCEVDCGCLAKGLPLLCEVVIALPLGEVVLVERGVRYSWLLYWRFPVWES